MNESKPLGENINNFMKLVQDLESLSVKVEDEDQVVILINYLPKMYATFVDTLTYGRHTLELDEVVAAIIAKDVEFRKEGRLDGDGLNMRGRTKKKTYKKRHFIERSK